MNTLFSNLLHKHNCCNVIVFALAVGVLTPFAGAKHGSDTNDVDAVSSPRQEEDGPSDSDAEGTPRPRLAMLPPSLTTNSQQLTTIPQWTARGAWMDWREVTFPTGFSFPSDTNLLTSVTLMSYGELRESLHGPVVANVFATSNQQPATNNQQLTFSLEPDASSVAYGLTPSNSFVFVWENACVNRDATNRINAMIELFPNGDIVTRFGDWEGRALSRPPEGFIGEGQNLNWATNAFPAAVSNIIEKGYNTWLAEDYVGYNEQNGHFRADITVSALPENGVPCYLVCGPHKIVVPQPGTFSFPLEVFETYEVRTYPVALPLSISTDDGYRGETSLLMSPPMMTSAPLILPPVYTIHEEPRLVISPTHIPLSQAVGTHISIWCNIANATRRFVATAANEFYMCFCWPTDAEIEEAEVATLVEIILESPKGTCSGTVYIEDDWHEDDPSYHWCCWWCCGDDCQCDGTCCLCNCGCHSGTNDCTSTSAP